MPAIAVGKFDALHLGHRALAQHAEACGEAVLARLTGMAEILGWPARQHLLAEADRSRVLAAWSAELGSPIREIGLPFARLRGLDPEAFVALCATELGASALVVGSDFRCGRGRAAGTAELAAICAERGLRLVVVPPLLIDGAPASSSRVRHALAAGDLAQATACLGRPHRLVGRVIRGDGRGRQLGFPTANLGSCDNLAPAPGVYAARAEIAGQTLRAAVNVGVLPTIGEARPLTVEAHLIGWSGDCYGSVLGLDLLARIRDERRFASLELLKRQIAADVEACRA